MSSKRKGRERLMSAFLFYIQVSLPYLFFLWATPFPEFRTDAYMACKNMIWLREVQLPKRSPWVKLNLTREFFLQSVPHALSYLYLSKSEHCALFKPKEGNNWWLMSHILAFVCKRQKAGLVAKWLHTASWSFLNFYTLWTQSYHHRINRTNKRKVLLFFFNSRNY